MKKVSLATGIMLLVMSSFAIAETKNTTNTIETENTESCQCPPIPENVDITKYCVYGNELYGKGSVVPLLGTSIMSCVLDRGYFSDSNNLVWSYSYDG
ncbi:hypothetical protein C5468_17780 [Photorhabdus luminescens subsp. mexicana]|uniref:DUF1496 domain-containing protein n=1 Tax=Photorhabdus luminescens subsp. mexicana TaxID=2100167 RepID=A0A4R4J360_PHOLU|nr:hypothetical protein C5468_17780 [Photorhabdus luminescens subsp. mexicana]